jgi:hypothetical protein
MMSPELLLEYIDFRLKKLTGEEKLHRHDCCRKNMVDELLGLKVMVIENSESAEAQEIAV